MCSKKFTALIAALSLVLSSHPAFAAPSAPKVQKEIPFETPFETATLFVESDETFSEPTTESSTAQSEEASSEPCTEPLTEPYEDFSTEASTEPATEPYAVDPISLDPVPAPENSNEWINLYIDKSLALPENPPFRINGEVYLPAFETASLLGYEASPEEKDAYGTIFVSVSRDGVNALLFENSRFAFVNGEKTELDGVSYVINDSLYTPASAFSSVFNVSCEEDNSGPDADFRISQPVTEAQRAYEKTVNSRHISSRTDYLIWVSKANYSVRLFKKSPSGWQFSAEFPCAIGAPGTPTCEGIYQFYERVAAWRYSTYYVGPIMRFNGGYAIHSTLVNYNGTPHDDRVGVKISHGCVRLHPKDIQYLFDTVPLYTTVYVTAE